MNRRLHHFPRRYAAWMLPAVFLWMMQPLASSLFCPSGSAHDDSAPSSTLSSENVGEHDEARADGRQKVSGSALNSAVSERPAPESCCSQIQKTPVTVAAAVSHSGSSVKDAPAAPPVAILPLTFLAEVTLSVSSRAGPDIPSLYSQLSRSSFSDRAPPFSA